MPSHFWPSLILAVLALDLAVWAKYGDRATLSGWLQAWVGASSYRAVAWIVACAWMAVHIVAGASVASLFYSLAGAMLAVFLSRLVRREVQDGSK